MHTYAPTDAPASVDELTTEEASRHITDGLNPEQHAAVTHQGGPLFVVAGAGTGKTRVLTRRAAWLVATGQVRPQRVLAVTFTNKAANEMKGRLADLLGDQGNQIWASTFHSACLRILRQHPEAVGYCSGLGVYDASETKALIRSICVDLIVQHHGEPPSKASESAKRQHSNMIGRATRQTRVAFAAEKNGAADLDDVSDPYRKSCQSWLPEAKARYIQRTKDANKIGFDDLLWLTARLFRENSAVLQRWRNKIGHCLVDEYQDTNSIQAEILVALCSQGRQITVVGDPDQAIYGFRHVQPDNFHLLNEVFPETRHVMLEQNYRSTMPILDTANALISHNPYRDNKKLWSEMATGDKPSLSAHEELEQETDHIATAIRRRHTEGVDWPDIAVMYRTNRQSRAFELALSAAQIPYKVVNATAFYDRREVRDALAFLKTWCNRNDDISLLRIVNRPARGIGKVTLGKKERLAAVNGTSVWDVLAEDARIGGTGKASAGDHLIRGDDGKRHRHPTSSSARKATGAIRLHGLATSRRRQPDGLRRRRRKYPASECHRTLGSC